MKINILDYLEESVRIYPNKVAFSDQFKEITYLNLQEQSKKLGCQLIKKLNTNKNKPICVFIDRNIESLVSFIGVVYSGNFYVPLDINLPKTRLEIMINKLKPEIIVSTKKNIGYLSNLEIAEKIIIYDDAISKEVDQNLLNKIRNQMLDTDPLYTIFTSGSTGTPKGVVICHRSVIDLIEHFTNIFGFNNDCVFGNQAPFDFDVSVKDIYSTLKNGATMHIIPKEYFSFPIKLIEYLNLKNINTLIWATSALRLFENLHALEKNRPNFISRIMFSGEVMSNKVLNYWRNKLPDVEYVNLYGPTEITCNCAFFIVNRKFDNNEMLPIGFPFQNSDIILLDEDNSLTKSESIGEICVRGTSLALGYYNDHVETKRAFVQNPLNPHYPEIIYRTGDLGKYNEFGELLFISRKDNQIKHMGHRIELGEIETAINALPFIDTSCCIFEPKSDLIFLFYQSAQKKDREILINLREILPKFMMPNKFIHFEKIPMNKNGKIDRTELKEIYINGIS